MGQDKRVQQEDSHGCAVACLAMALSITYKEARKLTEEYWSTFKPFEVYRGLDPDDEKIILYKQGFKTFDIRISESIRKDVRSLLTQPAMLTVPSINVPGLYHGLYWTGTKLYDPSPLKKYTTAKAFKEVRQIRLLSPLETNHYLYGIRGEERAHLKTHKRPKPGRRKTARTVSSNPKG